MTSESEQTEFPSYVHFGRPERFEKAEVSLQTHEDFFWSADWASVAFGNTSNVFAFEHNVPIYSIFDTGTTHLVLPETYFKSFVTTLMAAAEMSDYKYDKQVTFACADSFPSIYFNF